MEKKGVIAEFKEFIARGNVMDLAVGVIIGGAFSSITTSLINDLIMPLLGILTGSISFAALTVQVGPAVITYGNFIQAVLNFLVMALVVFWMVKAVNRVSLLGKKEDDAPAAEPDTPAAPTAEDLLAQILEELKKS
ncbi:MAG: large conductance mechanosensitive channel protein MscL [Oscillospiraceae bacterium]|jgi:large conductance mechanosensitive channel|nr:large conductance mechanosensitive channel protein MscL [Oscillospiraceae bacterium]